MKNFETHMYIRNILVLVLFVVIAVLMGCSTTVPVTAKFPDAPQTLLQKCPEKLQTIEGEKVNIIDFTKVIVINYGIYHECAVKNDAWIEWYNTQKKIFNEVK